MLPTVPILALGAVLVVGVIAYAGYSMLEVQHLHEEAGSNTQERLQERLWGEYEGTPTNIDQVMVASEWTDDTHIVGIMVTCDDNSVHTMEVDETIGAGGRLMFTTAMMSDLESLAGRCP